LRFGNFRRLG